MEAIGDCSKTNSKNTSRKKTVFWKKGFEILQNLQDRSTLEKHVKRARDPISTTTKNEKPNETNGTQKKSAVGSSNIGDILDVDKSNMNYQRTTKMENSKME